MSLHFWAHILQRQVIFVDEARERWYFVQWIWWLTYSISMYCFTFSKWIRFHILTTQYHSNMRINLISVEMKCAYVRHGSTWNIDVNKKYFHDETWMLIEMISRWTFEYHYISAWMWMERLRSGKFSQQVHILRWYFFSFQFLRMSIHSFAQLQYVKWTFEKRKLHTHGFDSFGFARFQEIRSIIENITDAYCYCHFGINKSIQISKLSMNS